FEAIQNFDLDDERLRWSISVTNCDIRPMPAGIGLHPFFAKSPLMELEFGAKAAWRNDARALPMGRSPVPPEWNFKPARRISDLEINNCFEGWTGDARIVWPEHGWAVALAADKTFGHLVVYTTPARDDIAIEPISHANNALNLVERYSDTAMHVLAPGETLSGAFTISPMPL
ncbi:MAG: aldose 1-epimerase, partial [Betaproteobacteria bacterium]